MPVLKGFAPSSDLPKPLSGLAGLGPPVGL